MTRAAALAYSSLDVTPSLRDLRPGGRAALALSLVSVLGLTLPAVARAQLAASSPFLPTGTVDSGGASGAASGPIELRGIMATAEGPRYCIFDTARKTSTWVGLNERGYDFLVKSQDTRGDADAVTVLVQGRTLHLTLRSAKVASALAAVPPGMPSPPTAITQSVVVNPTPADEARRLEAVAAEVQRRRLMREQALQGAMPGAGTPAGVGAVPVSNPRPQ